MNSPTEARLKQVDGLRAIAIIVVVTFHYVNNQLINATGFFSKLLCQVTSFGWCGVDLFFVLSGFLITRILIKNRESNRYFSTFYTRRTLRILPVYFLFLGAWTIVKSSELFTENSFLTADTAIPTWTYWVMLQNFGMAYYKTMGVTALSITWSLGIEEQFYLIFPMLIRYIREKHLLFILLIGIFVAIVSRFQFDHWVPKYVFPLCRLDSLCLGALVAIAEQKGVWARKRSIAIAFMCGTIVLLSIAVYWLIFRDLGVLKHTVISVIFSVALIMALSGQPRWYIASLSSSQFEFIAKISFSLYLSHYLVLAIAHDAILGNNYIGISNATDVAVTVLALLVSIAVSWVLFRWIESPLIKLGATFRYHQPLVEGSASTNCGDGTR